MGFASVSVPGVHAAHRKQRHLDRHTEATTPQRALGSLQGGHHRQSLFTVAQGRLAGSDALHEVLAFQPERLPPDDVWDDDFPVAVSELELAVVVRDRTLHALVV